MFKIAGFIEVRSLRHPDDDAGAVDDVGDAIEGIQQRLGAQASDHEMTVPFKPGAKLSEQA